MEPEGSLLCSQEPATGYYPDPDETNPHPQPYFPKIHFNIILPSTPRSSRWSHPSGFTTKIVRPFLISYIYPKCPAHLIFLNLIILIIVGEEKAYKLRSSSLYSFLHPPVTPSLLGSNTLLSTQFSNTLNLCSSFNVRDQVSYPDKQQV
jgi:hypothetical protein